MLKNGKYAIGISTASLCLCLSLSRFDAEPCPTDQAVNPTNSRPPPEGNRRSQKSDPHDLVKIPTRETSAREMEGSLSVASNNSFVPFICSVPGPHIGSGKKNPKPGLAGIPIPSRSIAAHDDRLARLPTWGFRFYLCNSSNK